jgi:DMSO/TMAO reductase YedYZ molybdopterin-dependent catalytic subunit
MPPPHNTTRLNRRRFLQGIGLTSLAAGSLRSFAQTTEELDFANGRRTLVRYPQKRPLILLTARPPHLETPFATFNESVLTPNDAFFVRYHLANMPTSIDPHAHRLNIGGQVDRPLSLSLNELKALGPPQDVVAVNQCSGNSRGYSSPRVFGSQLGNGSMGNARWTGISLRTVLEHVGIRPDARQVTFEGLDRPVLAGTPGYIKALDTDIAMNGDTMIAWAMNGEDLPFLNGYPIKLIVPGYFGTYWIKHLSDINVIDHEFAGFFMNPAYRVPDNDCLCVTPGGVPEKTRPITRLKVRSFITSLQPGDRVQVGQPTALRGIAFDGGSGIDSVDISEDEGRTWQPTTLGEDLGHYSFREWTYTWRPRARGTMSLKVRAHNKLGEQQPDEAIWNPSGYARNVIESLPLIAV